MFKVTEKWHECKHGGLLQQVYGNEYRDRFLIRRYDDYDWKAISLNAFSFPTGIILAEGQSDTDVARKVMELMELHEAKETFDVCTECGSRWPKRRLKLLLHQGGYIYACPDCFDKWEQGVLP